MELEEKLMLQEILEELKCINKKLDALTPSGLDVKMIISNLDEAMCDIFQE